MALINCAYQDLPGSTMKGREDKNRAPASAGGPDKLSKAEKEEFCAAVF